jgi:hypothetical protein
MIGDFMYTYLCEKGNGTAQVGWWYAVFNKTLVSLISDNDPKIPLDSLGQSDLQFTEGRSITEQEFVAIRQLLTERKQILGF